MIVVRLPDSPTEYGQRSVSPHTTATLDRGTPSASAAISHIVVFAPPPTSVTPTNTVYCPLASRRITALLCPSPDRKAMNETPAPRLSGPRSEPGCGRQRAVQSKRFAPMRRHSSIVWLVYGTSSRDIRVMFLVMNSTGSIFSLNATSSIMDSMP